jgi:hypothetical protein
MLGLQALLQELASAREQLLPRNPTGIDIGEERTLRCVFLVFDGF